MTVLLEYIDPSAVSLLHLYLQKCKGRALAYLYSCNQYN